MKTKLPWILTILLAIAFVAFRQTGAPVPPHALYWVDPMHPAYKSDKPGKAPDCGMELVPVYDDGSGHAPSNVNGYANVKLTSDRQQLIGVQTGMTELRSLGRNVRTGGRVAVGETRLY